MDCCRSRGRSKRSAVNTTQNMDDDDVLNMNDADEADYIENEEYGQKYKIGNNEKAFDQNRDDDDVLNMKDAVEAD